MVVEVEHANFEGVGVAVRFCVQVFVLNLQSASEVFGGTGRSCACECGCEKSSQMDHDCAYILYFLSSRFCEGLPNTSFSSRKSLSFLFRSLWF